MGQSGAALKPTAVEHIAAGFGGHPFHKAMFAGALAFFGLISSLRHELYLTTGCIDRTTPRPYPLNPIPYKYDFPSSPFSRL